jgi:hypothetical protein
MNFRIHPTSLAALAATIAAALAPVTSLAAPSRSVTALLNREIRLIEVISPFVERIDLPALLVLKRSAAGTLESIKTHGAAHMQTMQGLQEHVIQYRFSRSLLEQIRAGHTAKWLADLQKTAQDVAATTGFDESPYTRITLSVFTRIKDLLAEILKLPVPDELRAQIVSQRPELGRLLSKASEGDHAETFEAAAEMQKRIEALYPAFNAISIGNAAFNHVLEIQGLNEFYTRFASQPEGGQP